MRNAFNAFIAAGALEIRVGDRVSRLEGWWLLAFLVLAAVAVKLVR